MQSTPQLSQEIHQQQQEIQRVKLEMQAEKQERNVLTTRILAAVQAELERHMNSIEQKLHDNRVELRDALSEDLQADDKRFRASASEVSREVSLLRIALDEEAASRAEAEERLTQSVQRVTADLEREAAARAEMQEKLVKLTGDFERERQNQISNVSVLQSQVKSVSSTLDSEREEWARRRSDLLDKIMQHITEQERGTKQDRQARELQADQHRQELRQLVADCCSQEREQTQAVVARARQILDTDDALRQKLNSFLQTEIVSKADFAAETQRLWNAVTVKANRYGIEAAQSASLRTSSTTPRSARGFRRSESDVTSCMQLQEAKTVDTVSLSSATSLMSPRSGTGPVRVVSPVRTPSASGRLTPSGTGQAVRLVSYRSPSALPVSPTAPLIDTMSSIKTLPTTCDGLTSPRGSAFGTTTLLPTRTS